MIIFYANVDIKKIFETTHININNPIIYSIIFFLLFIVTLILFFKRCNDYKDSLLVDINYVNDDTKKYYKETVYDETKSNKDQYSVKYYKSNFNSIEDFNDKKTYYYYLF